MTQEILFTSAEKGLRPGSRGFCTVVSTEGMARNMAEQLERLSGYRHTFLPHDPNARLNPVNYSHLIISIAGRKYHVLSRICDAGLDYSKRSNKLAHHVVLDEGELTPNGPAAVLLADGFFVKSWDGETKIVQRRVPREAGGYATCPGPCSYWAKLAGDPGWGGVLAESAVAPAAKPVTLIFRPGQDVVRLVAESIALLPKARQWSVTFSTYFTGLPAGVDCRWRFLIDDSKEASAARRDARQQVMDLCRPLGAPPEGIWVKAARSGQTPSVAELEPVVSESTKLSLGGAATTHQQTGNAAGSRLPDLPHPIQGDQQLGRNLERDLTPSGLPGGRLVVAQSRSKLLPIAIGLSLLLLIGAVAAILVIPRDNAPTVVTDVAQTLPAVEDPPAEQPDDATQEDLNEFFQEEKERRHKETQPAETPTLEPMDVLGHAPIGDVPEPEAQPETKNPLDNVRARGKVLDLPRVATRQTGGGLRAPAEKPKPKTLARIYTDSPEDVKLELIGLDLAFPVEKQPTFEKREGKWILSIEGSTSLGKTVRPFLAKFRLDGPELIFEWTDNDVAGISRSNLRYCLLRIEVGDDSEVCKLTAPVRADPLRLVVQPEDTKSHIKLSGISLTEADPLATYLHCDLMFTGLPEYVQPKKTFGLAIGEPCIVEFQRYVERSDSPPTDGDDQKKKKQKLSNTLTLSASLEGGHHVAVVARTYSNYTPPDGRGAASLAGLNRRLWPISRELVEQDLDALREPEPFALQLEKALDHFNRARKDWEIKQGKKEQFFASPPREPQRPKAPGGNANQDQRRAFRENLQRFENAKRQYAKDKKDFDRKAELWNNNKELPRLKEAFEASKIKCEELKRSAAEAPRFKVIAKDVKAILGQMHSAQIEYRIYLKLGEGDIDLVRTPGMQPLSEGTGTSRP